MTRRRDPFIQALDSLRKRAEQGVFRPGQPVVIVEEARRLQLSTTPVREALAWLCGFGLIERAPTGGYLAPRLDPAILRDRLAFRSHCLMVSLNGASQHHPGVPGEGMEADLEQALYDHMLRAVRGTGNAALIDGYQRVSSQLLQLRFAERRVFEDLDAEAVSLVRLFEGAPGTGLPEAVAAYHQRRIEAAPLLVLEAEASRPSIAQEVD